MLGRYAWSIGAAVCVYLLWCAWLISQDVGLQYDEALLVLGAVHVPKSAAELPLPHEPNTWIQVMGHWLPLMTMSYVGPVKDYLLMPVFAALGPDPYFLRGVNALLGALGIWGIGRLLAGQAGRSIGVAAAFILAFNPGYATMIVFDNGTVAVWMGVLGLLCLTIHRYITSPGAWRAFCIGLIVGLGIWARANFVWLLVSLGATAVLVWNRALLSRIWHYGAAAAGAFIGGLPFLAYQVISGGATWQLQDAFRVHGNLMPWFLYRLTLFGTALLSDQEHRAMWSGPAAPAWQQSLFPAVLAAATLVCLVFPVRGDQRRWAHASALAFLSLALVLCTSRMPIAEHHVFVLTPLAAAVAATALCLLAARYRGARAAVALVAALYLGVCVSWHVRTNRGLRRTGGVGPWSDAIYRVSAHLDSAYRWRQINVLDWGLLNNLYVLNDAEINAREIYSGATVERASGGHRWTDVINMGGVFLINGPTNRQLPTATQGFLEAIEETKPLYHRTTFRQRNGEIYAELYYVQSHSSKR